MSSEHLTFVPQLCLPSSVLDELFKLLVTELKENPCDHSFRYTRAWAEVMGFEGDHFCKVLTSHQIQCDCQVILILSRTLPKCVPFDVVL